MEERESEEQKKSLFSFGVHFVISGKHILQWEGCQKPGCVVNKHFGEKLAERGWLGKEDLECLVIPLFICLNSDLVD